MVRPTAASLEDPEASCLCDETRKNINNKKYSKETRNASGLVSSTSKLVLLL